MKAITIFLILALFLSCEPQIIEIEPQQRDLMRTYRTEGDNVTWIGFFVPPPDQPYMDVKVYHNGKLVNEYDNISTCRSFTWNTYQETNEIRMECKISGIRYFETEKI